MRQPDGVSQKAAEDKGFALLIVLWAVVLLTFLVTQLTAAGRTELQLATNLRSAATAEAAADGAVHEAVFHLLDPSDPWGADGTERVLRVAGGRALLRIEDEAGKINPNSASPELLRALLRRLDADSRTADSLAAAIVDWRFPSSQGQPGGAKAPEYLAAGRDYGPAGAPFRSVADLGAVLGMTPELLARLRPNVSVLTDADPDPAVASPVVRQAIQDVRGPARTARRQPLRTVSVTVRVIGDAGGRFVRRAAIRLGSTPKEPFFQILAWDIAPD